MRTRFGKAQKAILGVLTFASVTSTVLCAMGMLVGDTWSSFNTAIVLGAYAALSGGKAAQAWAERSAAPAAADESEAP
jgi:hypothetical protein